MNTKGRKSEYWKYPFGSIWRSVTSGERFAVVGFDLNGICVTGSDGRRCDVSRGIFDTYWESTGLFEPEDLIAIEPS